MRFYFLIILVSLLSTCSGPANNSNGSNNGKPNSNTAKTSGPVPVYGYEIVKTYPHDSKAFVQGLVIHNNVFYESDGLKGKSNVRKVEIETGKVLDQRALSGDFFAEGLTIFNDKIYQITWQDRTAFVYDMELNQIREFRYSGDGWGLTHDGTNLIMSDGTHVIRFVDPESFKTVRTIVVLQENGKPLMDINELEYVKGEIWANIWRADEPEILGKPNYIARIDPASGKLLGWIDLGGISPEDFDRSPEENKLNGIAYDAPTDRIFVTGKNWKKLFEIKIKPKQ